MLPHLFGSASPSRPQVSPIPVFGLALVLVASCGDSRESTPREDLVVRTRAAAFFGEEQYQKARETLSPLVERSEPEAMDLVRAAIVELALDELDAARPLLERAREIDADLPEVSYNLGVLAKKGSLFVTRPTLATYIAATEDLQGAAGELFEVITSGAVKVEIRQTYPLAETERAHRDLESRKTTGSTVLLP